MIPSLLIATASIVAISGCAASPAAPSTPTESPAASPSTTPTASPTPEPTLETVADPADPSTWLIDAEGIGPVRLGMTLDEAIAAMPGYAVSTCPNPVVRFLEPEDTAGAHLAIAAGTDGSVALVTLADSDDPATAEDVRIGSTVADAKGVYPSLELSQKHTDRYTLQGSPGFITFSTDAVEAGDEAPIFTISVVTGGLPPWELCG